MDRDAGVEQILRGCDLSQREAITAPAATLLVIAGAGAGKTRVLTRRIAWRIATDGARPGATLALTFTRKAAAELRGRLDELGLPAPVHAGTFHAIALSQLRQRAIDRNRPLPVLIDRKSRLLSAVLPPWSNRRTAKAPLDRHDLLSSVAGEIEWAKARLIPPERYATEAARFGRTPAIDLDAVAEGFALYEKERRRRRLFDFDDLLTTLSDLIHRDPDFGAVQRWKFRHLHVDEFQDANAAQLQLLDAWAGEDRDLFCVGDSRQAIYGWNGADPLAMETFTTRYPGASVLELSTNYRSSAQLVRFAGAALPRSQGVARAARDEGVVPTILSFDNETDEAASVANQIRSIARLRGGYGSCAVLSRTNTQLLVIERALHAAKIPCRRNGTDQFLALFEVKRALDLLHHGGDQRLSGSQRFRAWLSDIDLETEIGPDNVEGDEDESASVDGESTDLGALVLIAREYFEEEPLPSPDGFQTYLEKRLVEDLLPRTGDGVDLLTFHRAKGLEWPTVFVIGLEDGFVPISHAKTRVALAEEQRLLYVALSRASDELNCSWARQRTFGRRLVKREPSPYLEPIEAMQRILVEEQRIDPETTRQALAKSRALLQSKSPRA